MNLQEFREEYEGAPFDDEELAQLIIAKLDTPSDEDHPLWQAACEFERALQAFRFQLYKRDFERG